MQQSLPQSDRQNLSESNQTPLHPKIKPLVRRSYKEYQLNETNYQKSLKAHSKIFRAVKTNTNKRRGSSVRYIKGYRKLLTAQDSLSNLSHSFNRHACFENAYLLSKIRCLRSLTSLDMQFFTNRDHQIPLNVLFKSLASLKELTYFKIELNFYTFNDAQTLRILFWYLQSLRKLKGLSLCFVQCSNFKRAKMNNLPQYLSHLKQLHSLELSFDRSMELTDQDMMSLASVPPKLPFLAQIKLDFGGQSREIQGPTLLQMFQNMKTLSAVTLNLGYSHIVCRGKHPDPLAEGLRQLQASSLNKLSLHLNQNLNTQSLFELSQTLKRFTSLNVLHLNLYGSNSLTNDSIIELSGALSTLITLSSFSFRVPRAVEADSIIGSIASGLKPFHNLVYLKLNLVDIKSSPKQIQQLSASLMNSIGLKFLEISFSWLQSLSDDVLANLAGSLRKLVQLKHLSLDFGYAKTVTNKGVKALANVIQELHGLSFLSLNFAVNDEIDGEAVERVSQILRQLPSLYSTSFRFPQCSKLEERSLSTLFNALRDMENIKEVALFLSQNEFNEQEVDDLKQRKILEITWFY